MIKRSAWLAAALVFASFAGQARAAFTVTTSGLTPTTTGSSSSTSYDFAMPATSQTSAGDFAQSFNVINVGEPTASATGSGSVTLMETLTITGDTGTLTGTLSGLFTINGALSSFTNRTFTVTSGSGFTVSGIAYTQPSPGSSAIAGSGTVGNISLNITPVPEPASMAMLGLGLAGMGGVTAYRRRRAR